jgi:hypothetical protein
MSQFEEVDDSSDLSIFGPDPIAASPVQPSRSSSMIAKTTVERSPNTVSERPPAHSPFTRDRGQIPPSSHGESQRPVSIPSRPSSLQSAETPGSEVRNFAVVISSPPGPLRITSPLDFGETETQDELAIGVSVPSSARRKRLQGTPVIKIDNEPSLTPKRNRMAYRHSKSIAAADLVQNKRGRPFRTSEIATKAVATDQTTKRRRRRSKLPPSAIDLPLPEPKFIPFLCEWEGCPAELHNLETLRSHIFTVHNRKRPSGTLPCLWTNCSPTSQALDNVKLAPNDQHKILQFKTKAKWQDHVNRSHLVPLAWHMGDGPKGTSLGKLLPISLH